MSMKSKFKPSWPRIHLESEVFRAVSSLPSLSGKCLNLGCGVEGRYAELLANLDVDGVDIAYPGARIMPWRFHRCDARQLPFADAIFDVAFAIESFEHIEDNNAAMQEVARTLKPGGAIVVTTPTKWTWPFEFGRHGPHYYSRKSLIHLVNAAGLQVHYVVGCGGLLFYCANLIKSWSSPIGLRLMGRHWWPFIDGLLMPVYVTSSLFDQLLPFPPSNWVLIGEKPKAK